LEAEVLLLSHFPAPVMFLPGAQRNRQTDRQTDSSCVRYNGHFTFI